MSAASDKNQTSNEDQRLPYECPDIVEAGNIAEITQSNGNDGGSDSSYS